MKRVIFYFWDLLCHKIKHIKAISIRVFSHWCFSLLCFKNWLGPDKNYTIRLHSKLHKKSPKGLFLRIKTRI